MYYLLFIAEQILHSFHSFLYNYVLKCQIGVPLRTRVIFLEKAIWLTFHGFNFGAEVSSHSLPVAHQVITFATSSTCKCSAFPRARADSEEIGNSENGEAEVD